MDLDPVLLSRLQFAWVIGWQYPVARLHRRHGLLHRDPGRTALGDRPLRLPAHLHVLDPDLLGGVRRRRGDGRDHALPVRHQLEPLRGHDGQCAEPAVRL
jgi:hypothetical protein